MEEIWKDVKDYEEYYQVSNKGRLRSKDRITQNRNGKIIKKGKILKCGTSKGYKVTELIKNGKRKSFYLHRLIAREFIPNVENKPCINHIDCNRKNNDIRNLEWVTYKENTAHMIMLGRENKNEKWHDGIKKHIETLKKEIVRINLYTGEKKFYSYLNQVREDGFNPANVCYACQGKYKTSKGYEWKYL